MSPSEQPPSKGLEMCPQPPSTYMCAHSILGGATRVGLSGVWALCGIRTTPKLCIWMVPAAFFRWQPAWDGRRRPLRLTFLGCTREHGCCITWAAHWPLRPAAPIGLFGLHGACPALCGPSLQDACSGLHKASMAAAGPRLQRSTLRASCASLRGANSCAGCRYGPPAPEFSALSGVRLPCL